MSDNREVPDGAASMAQQGRRSSITTYPRSGGLAVLVAAAAVALVAFSATSPSLAASLAKHGRSAGNRRGAASHPSRASSRTKRRGGRLDRAAGAVGGVRAGKRRPRPGRPDRRAPGDLHRGPDRRAAELRPQPRQRCMRRSTSRRPEPRSLAASPPHILGLTARPPQDGGTTPCTCSTPTACAPTDTPPSPTPPEIEPDGNREHQLQRHRNRPQQPSLPERARQPDVRHADRRTGLVDQQLGTSRKRRRLPGRNEPQQPAPDGGAPTIARQADHRTGRQPARAAQAPRTAGRATTTRLPPVSEF